MTEQQTTKAAAKRVAREVVAAIEDSKDNPPGWAGIKAIATEVVPRVEAIGHEFKLKGAQKKRIAIAATVQLLRRFVPGGWISFIPDTVLQWLIGWAIEAACKKMKSLLDKINKKGS